MSTDWTTYPLDKKAPSLFAATFMNEPIVADEEQSYTGRGGFVASASISATTALCRTDKEKKKKRKRKKKKKATRPPTTMRHHPPNTCSLCRVHLLGCVFPNWFPAILELP